MIPRLIFRTCVEHTTDQVEQWWKETCALHPGWDLRTYREPLDPSDWPEISDLWLLCQNGAQKAGLIRLAGLVRHGGIYLDADVQTFRSLAPLLGLSGFAAYEDAACAPDAILGFFPGHPAVVEMLILARQRIEAGQDAWRSGPGVTTAILPGRDDVLLLPPGSFYEIHWLGLAHLKDPPKPWELARHHWSGSWLTPAQKRVNQRRQR